MPATYLDDITQADFVLFMLDESYGTPRPSSGRSGVHEEWIRVREVGIPSHVYVKRRTGSQLDPRQMKFIESELEASEISPYRYSSTTDLLRQVRLSITQLALAIARSGRYRRRMDPLSVIADVVEHDHEAMVGWGRALSQLLDIDDLLSPQFVTDAWAQMSDMFPEFTPDWTRPFLDGRSQSLFAEFLRPLSLLAQHYGDHADPNTASAQKRQVKTPIRVLNHTAFGVARNLPDDFFERTITLKSEIRERWRALADLVQTRYVKFRRS